MAKTKTDAIAKDVKEVVKTKAPRTKKATKVVKLSSANQIRTLE